MTEPTTRAGKALVEAFFTEAGWPLSPGDYIAAIEAEARQQERLRICGALANWAAGPGESFRTLPPYLDMPYAEAYREGWMAVTNAIFERVNKAEAAERDRIAAEVEALQTWPRVSWFAYDARLRDGTPLNPTEDVVVIARAAVLRIVKGEQP